MRPRILVIDDDDLPDLPADWQQARTVKDAIAQLSECRSWDAVYFDHDLGPEDTMGVVTWLEITEPRPYIEQVFVHSMNPAGAEALTKALSELFPTRRIPLPFQRRRPS